MENDKEFKEISDEEIEQVAGGDSVNKDNCGRSYPYGYSRKCMLECTSKSVYNMSQYWCPLYNTAFTAYAGLPEYCYTN